MLKWVVGSIYRRGSLKQIEAHNKLKNLIWFESYVKKWIIRSTWRM